jgi:hypothetical protein
VPLGRPWGRPGEFPKVGGADEKSGRGRSDGLLNSRQPEIRVSRLGESAASFRELDTVFAVLQLL